MRRYVVKATQEGSEAPNIIVLRNTLLGTPVWTRRSVGRYMCRLDGAFPADKTFIQTPFMDDWQEQMTGWRFVRINDDECMLQFCDLSTVLTVGGATEVDGFSNVDLEIRVYDTE